MEKRILIIDSELSELRKIRSILSREGYNIVTAADIKTAADLLEKIDMDYILVSSELVNPNFNNFFSNK